MVAERQGKPGTERKRGLLLVPEFPYDSFWSYRYILRLIGRKAAFPPLGLLTLAGYLPDWDLELLDLNVRHPSPRVLRTMIESADVAFVSAMSIQKRSLVELVQVAHGLDTPIVLGGALASSFRDQILHPSTDSDRLLNQGLDVLVWGEAGPALPELLEHLREHPTHRPESLRLIAPDTVTRVQPGSRRYLNDRSIFRPLETPIPRWDLINVRNYQSMMIQTTAGCPFRCDFCDIIQFNGGFTRPKRAGAIRAELRAILDTGYRGGLFSVDDNFIGNPAATAEILDTIIEFQREHDYPFSFYTQASVNLGSPALEPLILKMKHAGFDAVFLGIENPAPAALHSMNKKQNVKVDIPAAVAKLQDAGIEVYAGFILGSDADTPSTAESIIEFVKQNRIFTAMTGMLTPIPQTPLYERLRGEGRLMAAEYSGNNTDDVVQFRPDGMTVTQLRDGIQSVLSRLFEPPESYRRALEMIAAVKPHIFSGRMTRPAYIMAAAASIWRQGVRRLDPAYFALLWRAYQLDRRLRGENRREARQMRLLGRRHAAPGQPAPDAGRADELLARAQDYLLRFHPEQGLAQVNEWGAQVRARIAAGSLSMDEMRVVCDHAARYFKAQMRRHRFPGIGFTRAITAALKAMHYEKVMRAIVGPAALRLHSAVRSDAPLP